MLVQATIVFTTNNRSELLKKAIQSAKNQSVPVDIIVMDDNSTDGTHEMMSRDFPDIQYYRSSENKGPCYHRNKGIELSKTKIVFPLDDDSILDSQFTIEQTLQEFDHPQVAAVAIPFINILQDKTIWTKAPDRNQIYLTHAYVAAAHAVDREKFLSVGGYREFFFYMGEEGDLCIRLLQKRFCVRLGAADPIHHYQPPNRISKRPDVFGRQNDILFPYFNAPKNILLISLIGTTLKGLWFGIKVRRPIYMLEGFYKGYSIAIKKGSMRNPVDQDCFHIYRFLKKRHIVPLEEIKTYLNSTNI
ncbi:glycosyltransferase family 2 protein [Anabaena cylindrica FACHB-243]|uniref:Glycosyl transferase family 2 n=1 Tax=Anabaena cylindrica (strain ATCC 27899 / PCC 7122) TaxID=272123 RepID=K9ZK61_ANACC|nr:MULTISPECIES: glycosyltransferase family A protein [Anabaena]AFZ59159.1 glycosyl transferase family 2 [Anabaena cylindrica PCC 7122]MBD2416509.1 glycosyltransferase family 2 protein [Anabaena cylindrica FACHB-243]MBY5281081.1 glycosyltransferase family 2 protein [Anabaena sp. CCAP 1446/1C]MBY5309868.1 glycosyltransferase family 2 protein [Anabaena sp. CCAP 1446/1C]MCM2407447.1 glycosyltransferase family 2 protein [Anabaena sp. CCAP 1446/1C]